MTTFLEQIQKRLEWEIRIRVASSHKERIEAAYRKEVLTLTVSSQGLAYFALQTYAMILKSGYIGDFLGVFTPRYPFRGVSLRSDLDDAESALQYLSLCGFNALVDVEIDPALAAQYGFRCVSRLQCPWERGDAATEYEALKTWVKPLREQLLSIDNQDADRRSLWLPRWLDDIPETNTLAVQASHPFWEKLRLEPDQSSTPLIQILGVEELSQELLASYRRQPIVGMVYEIDGLPEEGSSTGDALWVAGQALWWDLSLKEISGLAGLA